MTDKSEQAKESEQDDVTALAEADDALQTIIDDIRRSYE